MTQSVLIRKELFVKKSSVEGYGVFAATDIDKDDIIEECYALHVSKRVPDLINYVFTAGAERDALPLGYGAIYNHAVNPNADYLYDIERGIITFKAIKTIKKNEEIFVNYGSNWFPSRAAKCKRPSLWFRFKKSIASFKLLARFSIVLAGIYTLLTLIKFIPLLAYFGE